MARQRRTFSPDFKLKVVVEALQEKTSLTALAQKHKLQANQIIQWKQEVLASANAIFSKKGKDTSNSEEAKEELYKKIGQLQMEVDFLKSHRK